MLTQLAVQDFAVARRVELEFGPGMSVISGETGAGKSLLVDALLLLTGARADSGVVRHGAERAELSAGFDLADAPAALAWLRENELDEADACQLRRVIRADGGSRAWINGRPATLGQLAELGALLVEIHGQHEHQALLERPQQLQLLDAFGGQAPALAPLAELSRNWQALRLRIEALGALGDVGDRVAYLRHQLDELERESLDPADIEALLAAHRRQAHAATLLQGCEQALARLSGEEGDALGAQLRQQANALRKLAEHEPRLREAAELLDSAQIQLDEATAAIERAREDLDLDPQRLQQLDQRLARLHDLARKHRVALHELQARRQALAEELESLRGADATLARLRDEQAAAEAQWRAGAKKLGLQRMEAAQRLGPAIEALMAELGMGGGRFAVQLEALADPSPNPQGTERCEFLVSANPGQPPRPLRKVASGGELARISLAIEVALLGLDAVPSMVFDEVDSGIGGAVAETVGQKLRALGGQRQVLCVTHLPQVAAQGHQHYRASKSIGDGAAYSEVALLSAGERIEEIARMLGGAEITRETRANARQLIGRAAGERDTANARN